MIAGRRRRLKDPDLGNVSEIIVFIEFYLGLSDSGLAKRLGVVQSTVSRARVAPKGYTFRLGTYRKLLDILEDAKKERDFRERAFRGIPMQVPNFVALYATKTIISGELL